MLLPELLTGFFRLFYPKICCVCGNDLGRAEEVMCIPCLYHIPLTRFWDDSQNPVAQIFWGRVDVQSACAYFYFQKGSRYRPMLHQLKYKGHQEIGRYLGLQLGRTLAGATAYAGIECVVPVPLHPARQRARGYNQAECIAQGISQGLNRPLYPDALKRLAHTETQTRRSRSERVMNVADAFAVGSPKPISGKHILLVDDVITTGATLEACASRLLGVGGCRVSIAVLAFTSG